MTEYYLRGNIILLVYGDTLKYSIGKLSYNTNKCISCYNVSCLGSISKTKRRECVLNSVDKNAIITKLGDYYAYKGFLICYNIESMSLYMYTFIKGAKRIE